uniref:3-beta hydroxysteroid dehydrogenase/isomerase domain-containing protein n=1 Tax=Leptobrachium leishanense TaxID=445787 RepID=A0A8C5M6G0_9ANUR
MVQNANGKLTNHGIKLVTCVIRAGNLYGEKTDHLLQSYINAKSGNNKINYIGPETIEQNYTYVGNVAWMHVLAARQLQLKPELMEGQVYYAYDDTPLRQQHNLLFDLYKDVDPGIQLGSRIPYWKIWLIVNVYNFIAFLLSPFWSIKKFLTTSILNYMVTTFSYETDKAFRHFGYQPKYSWPEAKLRTCKWLKCASDSSKEDQNVKN